MTLMFFTIVYYIYKDDIKEYAIDFIVKAIIENY